MSSERMEKPKDWITSEVFYDSMGQQIFFKREKVGDQLLVDVRGWGSLQYKFSTHDEAAEFQDKIGQFIADAINEKLRK